MHIKADPRERHTLSVTADNERGVLARIERVLEILPSAAQGRCPQGGGVAAFSGGRCFESRARRSLRSHPSGAARHLPCASLGRI